MRALDGALGVIMLLMAIAMGYLVLRRDSEPDGIVSAVEMIVFALAAWRLLAPALGVA